MSFEAEEDISALVLPEDPNTTQNPDSEEIQTKGEVSQGFVNIEHDDDDTDELPIPPPPPVASEPEEVPDDDDFVPPPPPPPPAEQSPTVTLMDEAQHGVAGHAHDDDDDTSIPPAPASPPKSNSVPEQLTVTPIDESKTVISESVGADLAMSAPVVSVSADQSITTASGITPLAVPSTPSATTTPSATMATPKAALPTIPMPAIPTPIAATTPTPTPATPTPAASVATITPTASETAATTPTPTTASSEFDIARPKTDSTSGGAGGGSIVAQRMAALAGKAPISVLPGMRHGTGDPLKLSTAGLPGQQPISLAALVNQSLGVKAAGNAKAGMIKQRVTAEEEEARQELMKSGANETLRNIIRDSVLFGARSTSASVSDSQSTPTAATPAAAAASSPTTEPSSATPAPSGGSGMYAAAPFRLPAIGGGSGENKALAFFERKRLSNASDGISK